VLGEILLGQKLFIECFIYNSMNNQILITSYKNPDLDGTACAFAYAELLNKQNRDAIAVILGNPHREAQFVLDKYSIDINKIESLNEVYKDTILVDASDFEALPNSIKPKQISEIIDHRKLNDSENFPNAKVQIELVGACATLIAEKFLQNNIPISKHSAVLLYSAIVSNTINFQGNVTTARDKDMASWLSKQIELPSDFIHEIFVYKSNFTQPLKQVLIEDFKAFQIHNKKVGIAQLEIINANDYANNNLSEIKNILSEIKQQKSLDYIFLNCIDLEGNGNTFVSQSEIDTKLLEKVLKVKFDNSIANSDRIMMRKEIVPLMKEVMVPDD